ncbi:MAG: hypothetical protein ABIP55_17025, partial [Tepidisphaeraceae bacterium]
MRLYRPSFACMTAAVAAVVLLVCARAGASLIVPAFSSLPGAFTKLYIDFDGDNTPTWGPYAPGITAAYSTDADLLDFSSSELTNIEQIWRGVSEKYS